MAEGIQKENSDISVVIVGAGLSGLAAAKVLHENGVKDVVVLEARNRVGGRTFTLKSPAFKYIDLGGEFVTNSSTRMKQLVSELGIKTSGIHIDGGKSFLFINGKRIVLNGTMPSRNPFLLCDLNHFVRSIDKEVSKLKGEEELGKKENKKYDRMTAKEWFQSLGLCKEALSFTEVFVRCMLSCESHEISMLYLLFNLKSSLGGFITTGQSQNFNHDFQLVGGTQQVSERMADILGKDIVVLNSQVVKIHQKGKDVQVTTENGKTFTGSHCIITVPPPLIQSISFSPPLPPLKCQLLQHWPMGATIKSFTFYKSAFWKTKGFNGFTHGTGPVVSTMDGTKPDGSLPCLVGFINGDDARQTCHLTPSDRKRIVTEYYSQIFDSDEALRPLNYVELNWMSEKYSGGGYTAIMGPGTLSTHSSVLRSPAGRAHFAGSETSLVYPGYMEGAVRAGERAAREILDACGLPHQVDDDSSDSLAEEYPLHTTLCARLLPKSKHLKIVLLAASLLSVAALAKGLVVPRLIKTAC